MITSTDTKPGREEQTSEDSLSWIGLWERQAGVGMCGVQGARLHNVKYYRAYATAQIGDELKRVESDVYEACDAADVDETKTRWGSIIAEHVQVREIAIAEAETARALMTSRQRSPKDMQAQAIEMAKPLAVEAQEYDIRAAEEERQRIYDAEALAHFNLWFRGGIVRFGEDAMRRLFQQIPGAVKKTP